MKILFVYLGAGDVRDKAYKQIAKYAPDDVEIIPFNIALSGNKYRLEWRTLNVMLKAKDPELLDLYKQLVEASCECDVLLHYNGWNIHPNLIPQLKTFNVYCFFDDPESSYLQSQHVAPYFDAVFYGNIASKMQYQALGIKKIAWLPIFVFPHSLPSEEQKTIALNNERDSNAIICCGLTRWREMRLRALNAAFPNAIFYGAGWGNGRVSDEQLNQLYLDTYIGWNVHNSTGPINIRLFSLAAFGMLQICDNKVGLSNIFKLGEEVVGYDSTEEAIELTHYYLNNKDEGRKIARAGFNRYWSSYNTSAVWERIIVQLVEWKKDSEKNKPQNALEAYSLSLESTKITRLKNKLTMPIRKFMDRLDRGLEKRKGGDKWLFSEDVLNKDYFSAIDSTNLSSSYRQRPWPRKLNMEAFNLSTMWVVSQMLPTFDVKDLMVSFDGLDDVTITNFFHLNRSRDDINIVNDNNDVKLKIIQISLNEPDFDVNSIQTSMCILIIDLLPKINDSIDKIISSLKHQFSLINLYYLQDPYVPFVQRWSREVVSIDVPQIFICCSQSRAEQ